MKYTGLAYSFVTNRKTGKLQPFTFNMINYTILVVFVLAFPAAVIVLYKFIEIDLTQLKVLFMSIMKDIDTAAIPGQIESLIG